MRTLLVSSTQSGKLALDTCARLAAAGGLSGSRTLLWITNGETELEPLLSQVKPRETVPVDDLGALGTGRLYRAVLPGLDILATSGLPSASDQSLELLLGHSEALASTMYAWCLVPSRELSHESTQQVLPLADEMILEMRATGEQEQVLSGVLDHLKNAQERNGRMMFRGVLLHSAGEEHSAAEENLRQTLGRRVLPLGIPVDAALGIAENNPLTMQALDSPAGEAFRELAEALGVARPSSAIFTKPGRTAKSTIAAPSAASASNSTSSVVKAEPGPGSPRSRERRVGVETPTEASPRSPDAMRRNEVRSFLDLEPYEPPPTGLEPQDDNRLPSLEEHLNVFRPAGAGRPPSPAPMEKRPPSASGITLPPPQPARRSPSSPNVVLQPTQTMRRMVQDNAPMSSNLPWILTAGVILLMGVGLGYLGLLASETGNLSVFFAFMIGLGVAIVVLVVGLLSSRKPPDELP